MKKTSITEAKNRFSALIDSVKGGASVLIVDRGRPVARLEPVTADRDADDGRLARLVRDGVIRPGRKPPNLALFKEPPPRAQGDVSAVAALIEERRDGR